MKLFFVDDSNIDADDKLEFFIYGGIILGEESVRSIILNFISIKEKYGVPASRPVKWVNYVIKNGPVEKIDPETHRKIKSAVLEMISKTECRIIIYLAPHYFYQNKNLSGGGKRFTIDLDKQINAVKLAINICAEKFNKYLKETNCFGLILADNFGEGKIKSELDKHCLDIYPRGTINFKGEVSCELERVCYPILKTKFDYSPVHQINDIVLGAIQHSLKEIARDLIGQLKDNFWSNKNGKILDFGVSIYPKEPKTQFIAEKIQNVKNKFNKLFT